jgi:tyrosyl-tRNA synthetase
MEETLEGGRGPLRAVAPLERERERVDEDDIEEFLEAFPEELTNEELFELTQEHILEEEAREKETAEEKEEPQRKFTVKGLAEALADLNKLLKKYENKDPQNERFSLTKRNVDCVLSAYKQIYDEKKEQTKQTTMDIFPKRVTPQEKPKAGPSGSIPEEGIVITGDDSSMQVIAPEDPTV